MQRLEQLLGKALFARHGRNKLLTEEGIELLGYARKILRFNDEACTSLLYGNIQGVLTLGISDDIADTFFSSLLSRVTSLYPKLVINVQVKRHFFMMEMLNQGKIDLVVTTSKTDHFTHQILRTSPTLWFCAENYVFHREDTIPLVLLEEPCTYHDMAIDSLNKMGIPWRISYVASTLAAVRALVKAGLGVTAQPIEMMSPALRVMGVADGLPTLPDTQYSLCCKSKNDNELVLTVFSAMEHNDNLSSMIVNSHYDSNRMLNEKM